MIMIVCDALPQNHCYRKSPIEAWCEIEQGKSLFEKPDGIGGAIGFLIWQVAMNLYLNFVDKWAVEKMGLHYTRFADDTVIVVNNKEAALALLPKIREMYKSVGCTMHPRKFYCRHYSKGLRFLGSYIKFDRVYLADRTLRKAMSRVAKYNRVHSRLRHSQEFLSSINSYIGMMKNRSEFKNIVRLYDAISLKWKEIYSMGWDRLCLVANEGYDYKNYLKYMTNGK